MNCFFTILFLIFSFTGFSQQDIYFVKTNLSVDSLTVSNRDFHFFKVNDSVQKITIDRNTDSTVAKLLIYSEKKTYEIALPTNPVTEFPTEWNQRDPKYPVTMRISVEKGKAVLMRADGSAVNMSSSLIVCGPSGDIIKKESFGIVTPGKKSESVNHFHGL